MKTEQQESKKIAGKGLFYFLAVLFTIDRLSKLFFVNSASHFKNFHLFQLSFSINKNIAFGLVVHQAIIFFLFFLILVFLFHLLIKNYRKNNLRFVFFLSLIIIGALSNLLDRIKFGGVIDFIYVPYFTVFNFADIYITIGVALWLWEEHKNYKKTAWFNAVFCL